MSTYALVDASNVVENVIIWDGDTSTWEAPDGITPIEVTDSTGVPYIGGTYSSGGFSTIPASS